MHQWKFDSHPGSENARATAGTLKGTIDVTVVSIEGCKDFPLDAVPTDNPILEDEAIYRKDLSDWDTARLNTAKEHALRALALDLIELQKKEAPASAPAPPHPHYWCMVQWQNHRGFGGGFTRPITKIVYFKSRITGRGRALNLGSDGGRIQLFQRHLVGVTGLVEQDPTTTLIEYEDEWSPTDAGRTLGQQPFGRELKRAIAKKYDDGWRLVG